MKMKKFMAVAGSIVLGVSALSGCGSSSDSASTTNEVAAEVETTVAESSVEETTQAETTFVATEAATEASTEVESKGTITVAASATPHAEILEYAAPILAEQGWDLEVTVFDDYVQPNLVVDSGEFDANYFQHIPYLDNFNEERGTDLVNAGGIHYEPFGIYPGTKSSLDDIADGDTIAVPNDTTNEARALLLLEANGIITLKDGVGLEATVKDIDSYAVDINIQELEAAQVSRVTDEVAYVVLNGNYALEAGYSVGKDALAYETSDSEAAQTYVNVIAVKAGNEDSEKIQALVDVLKSDDVKQFINDTYDGAVIPFE
jgi:D-methionine transport system substrate-binding protein